MAVFTPDTVGNIKDLKDIKKIQEYLYRLNEQLQYVLRNLTPEDNDAAGVPALSYATNETVKIIVDGDELDIVLADEVIKAINESIETAKINANRMNVNGIASTGNKFTISSLGVPAMKDGTISNTAISNGTISGAAISNGTVTGADISNGTISGADISNGTIDGAAISNGTITGATISNGTITGAGISNGTIDSAAVTGGTITGADVSGGTIDGTTISDATATDTDHQSGKVGPFDIDASGLSNTDASIDSSGNASFAELTLADAFWGGQTVTQICQTMWNALFP